MKKLILVFIAMLFFAAYAQDEIKGENTADEKATEEKVVEEKVADEKISDEIVSEEEVVEEEVAEKEVAEEEVAKEEVAEEEVAKEEVVEEEVVEEEVVKEEVVKEEVAEEEVAEQEVIEKKVAVDKKSEDKIEQEKINIAVFDLQNRGRFNTGEIKLITDRINSELDKVEKFTLVERQQIGAILKEQGFQQTGACSDQQCMVEAGQLLAVKKVVGGSIGGIENVYPVSLKIIDVRTGKIEALVIRDVKASKAKLLSEYIPEITHDLMVRAGYVKVEEEEKSLFSKARFWVPSVALVSGAVVAVILFTRDDDSKSVELDISTFPDHNIEIPDR